MNETTNIRKKKNKNSIDNYMNNNNFNNMNNNAQNSYNKNMNIDEYDTINPIFKISPIQDMDYDNNSQNNNYNKYQSNNNQINSQNNNFQNSNNIINNSNYNMNNNYYNNNSNVNYMNNQNNGNFNNTNINYNNINYNNYNNNGNFNNNYNINNLNSINPDTYKVFSRKQSNNNDNIIIDNQSINNNMNNNINNFQNNMQNNQNQNNFQNNMQNNNNNQNMFNFKAMMNPVSKKSNSNINNNQNMFNNNNNNIINNGNFNNGFNNNNTQNIFQNNNFQNTMQNNQNNILNVMNMTSRKYPSNNNNRNMFNYKNMIVEQYNNNINNQNQFDVNKGIANISFTGSADIVDIINDKVEDLKKQCQKRPLTIILTVDEKYKDSFFTGYIKKCLIDNREDLIIKVKEKINEKTFKTTKYGLKENKEMIATPELLETEGENRVNNLHEFQQIKEHAIDLGNKAITFESDIESVFPNYFRLFENSSWFVKGGIDKMIEDICKKENKNHEEYKRVLQNMRDPEKLLCDYTHEDITIMCDIADHISSNNYDEIIFPKDTEKLPKICLVGDLLSSRPLLNNEDVYIPDENSDSHAPGVIKGIGGRSFTVFDIKKDENGSFQTTINKIIDTGKITKCCVNFLNKLNNKLNEDAFKYGKEILYVLFRKNNYIKNNMDDTSFFNVCKGIYNNQNEISPTDTRKFLEKINFYNIAGNHEYGFSKSKGITGEYDIFGVFDENRNKNKVKISSEDFVKFREELDKNGFKLVHRPEHCIYDICYKKKEKEDEQYFENCDINEIDKQKINLLNKIPLFRSLNFSSNNNLFVAKHTDYFPLGFVKTDLKTINIDNDDCLNLLRQQKDYISDRSYNKLFGFYTKKEKKNLDTINYDSEYEETIDNIMKDIFLIYGHNHNFYTKVNDQIEKLVPADTQNREQKIQEIKNKIAKNDATTEQRQAIQGLFKNKLCIDIDNIENKDHFQNCKNRNNPSFTLKNGEIKNELLNFRLNGEKGKIFNLLKTEEQMKKEECQRIIPNAFKDCQDKSLTFTDIKPGTKIKASSDLEGNFIHFIFSFITGGAMDKDKLKLLSDKTKELLGLDKNGNIKKDLITALQEYDKFIQNNCGCIKESSVFYDESKFLLGHAYNKFQTPQCQKLINDINQYLKPISQYSDEDFEAIRKDKINIVSAIKEIEGDQILLLLGDTLSLRVFKNSSNLGPFKIDQSVAVIKFSDLPLNNTEQLEQKAKEVRQICDNFLLTYELIVDMLEQMKNKNPKKFLNLIGNHDITSTLDKININYNVNTGLLSKKQAKIVNDLYYHLRNYVNQRIRKYKERILKLSDFTVIYKTNHKKPHEILYSHTTNRINASKDGEEKYPLAKFLRKNDDDKLFHIDGVYGFKESFLTYPNKPLEALYKYYTWDNNKDDQHFQEKHKEETHKYLQERNRTIIYGHQHKAIGQLLSKKLPEYGRLLNTDCHTFEFGMFYTIQTEITDKGLRHSYLNGITGNEVRSIKNENNKITEVKREEMAEIKQQEENKRKEEEKKIDKEKETNKNKIKDLEKKIKEKEKIEKELNDLKNTNEKNKKTIEELKEKIVKNEKTIIDLNKEKEKNENKIKELNKVVKENDELKKKVEELNNKNNEIAKTVKSLELENNTLNKEINKNKKEIIELQNKIQEGDSEKEKIKKELNDLKNKNKEYKEIKENNEQKLTKLNEEKEKNENKIKELENKIKENEETIIELNKKITENEKTIIDLNKEKEEIENKIKELNKVVKENDELKKKVKGLNEDITKNKETINKLNNEKLTNNTKIEKLTKENNELKKKVETLNKDIAKNETEQKNLEEQLQYVRNENNRLHTVNRKLTNELNRFRTSTTLVRSGNNNIFSGYNSNIFSGHNKNNKYDKPTIVEISDKEREELGKKHDNIIINNVNKHKINISFTEKEGEKKIIKFKEDEKENKKLELENLKLGLGSTETAKEIKLETQNYNDFDKSNNKKYMQIKLFNNELFNNTFKHLNIKKDKKETLKEDEKDKVNNDLKKIAEESNKDKPKTNISRMNEFFYNNNNKTSISSNKYSIFDRNKPITINSKTAEKQISNGPIKINSKTAEKQIITLKNIEDKKEKIEDKKEININIGQSTTYPMHNNSNKNKFERYDANTSYINRKRFDDVENKMRKIINNSQQCNEYNIEKYQDKCPFFK